MNAIFICDELFSFVPQKGAPAEQFQFKRFKVFSEGRESYQVTYGNVGDTACTSALVAKTVAGWNVWNINTRVTVSMEDPKSRWSAYSFTELHLLGKATMIAFGSLCLGLIAGMTIFIMKRRSLSIKSGLCFAVGCLIGSIALWVLEEKRNSENFRLLNTLASLCLLANRIGREGKITIQDHELSYKFTDYKLDGFEAIRRPRYPEIDLGPLEATY
ncbi:MAG: hypothetical protein LVR00_02115 [Rhabdochlamydiaceae bacterium]